jgi:hypothetical protein
VRWLFSTLPDEWRDRLDGSRVDEQEGLGVERL